MQESRFFITGSYFVLGGLAYAIGAVDGNILKVLCAIGIMPLASLVSIAWMHKMPGLQARITAVNLVLDTLLTSWVVFWTGGTLSPCLPFYLTTVMAADGQMDPVDLPTLLAPLIAGEADYVKGNRLGWPAASAAMPWHRWLGNHMFSWLTRVAIGVRVQDSQCGYAAMNRRAKETLEWDRLWKGYGYPNDLLSWLTLGGLRVREIPVRPIYGTEQSGIRPRHVMWVIPFVIGRAWLRRAMWRREPATRRPRPT